MSRPVKNAKWSKPMPPERQVKKAGPSNKGNGKQAKDGRANINAGEFAKKWQAMAERNANRPAGVVEWDS